MRTGSTGSNSTATCAVLATLVIGLLAANAPVCNAQAPGLVHPNALPDVVTGPYKIAVGDVLEINFFKATQMSQVRTVGPDGEIFLPLVGRVSVFGRTVDDVTAELTERYSAEMVNPQINVSVAKYSGLKVYVGGEVNFPGLRDYRGGLTLVQAVHGRRRVQDHRPAKGSRPDQEDSRTTPPLERS